MEAIGKILSEPMLAQEPVLEGRDNSDGHGSRDTARKSGDKRFRAPGPSPVTCRRADQRTGRKPGDPSPTAWFAAALEITCSRGVPREHATQSPGATGWRLRLGPIRARTFKWIGPRWFRRPRFRDRTGAKATMR